MDAPDCVTCRTLRGEVRPPGGIVYEEAHWAVFLRARPPLIAGQAFIVLRRHSESIAELTADEQQALGAVMTRTARAMTAVLGPERVHFGLYAESVRHIHLHVTPRTTALPAGNIPVVALGAVNGLLERLKLRPPIVDAAVEAIAARLRDAFAQTTT